MVPKSLAIFFAALLTIFPLSHSTLAQTKNSTQPVMQTATQAAPSADISKISDEATVWLQDLLRIDTSNGNEIAAAKYVGNVLQKENIPFEIFESEPGRATLVARLSAGPFPDPSRAIMLLAHLDVVGVDKSRWTVDPFGGVIQNGYLYGRGTIDDKGMVAANIATLVALKRSGARLNRDVILVAEADEEHGGTLGIKWMLQKHWDKIAGAFALNEGGGPFIHNGKVQWVNIQSAEKVSVNVSVIATGPAGHGSVPIPNNAVVHLANAVAKIGAYEAPVQFNTITRAYFDGIAQFQDDETAKWMRALDSPDRKDHAARIISQQNPVWNSMLRDSIAPTILQAGFQTNVIPSTGRANLNVRLLPGNLIEPLVAKLNDLVADPQIRFEIDPNAGAPAPSSSVTSELYTTITKVAAADFSGAPTVPQMSTFLTDSAALRLRSVEAYGLLPFPLSDQDIALMHSDNERISLDAFRKGVVFLHDVVANFAVQQH
jgi:acetylornithine deacetylase/succinyl-diaminopimelate desuccinylase-like protein